MNLKHFYSIAGVLLFPCASLAGPCDPFLATDSLKPGGNIELTRVDEVVSGAGSVRFSGPGILNGVPTRLATGAAVPLQGRFSVTLLFPLLDSNPVTNVAKNCLDHGTQASAQGRSLVLSTTPQSRILKVNSVSSSGTVCLLALEIRNPGSGATLDVPDVCSIK
jgi:hypothetical protein